MSEPATVEVHVTELRQLFNTIDPSPFREKDLDPGAEQFIVEWAREVPSGRPLALVVHVDRPAGSDDEAALRDAVRGFFSHSAEMSRRRLRQLFARGRVSLAIGMAYLAISLALGDVLARVLDGRPIAEVVRESLLIGGWVAMWGPMEVFLYDWWPIRAEAQLADRLAAMPVRVVSEPVMATAD